MTQLETKVLNLLQDREWRLSHLYSISTKDGEIVRFRPNWAQLDLLRRPHLRKNILKARQLGMSTFITIIMLDSCLFAGENPKNCAIVDKNEADAKEKLKKITLAYNALGTAYDDSPDEQAAALIGSWLKEHVKLNPIATILNFSNGSVISAGVSKRGGTLQILHVSELGYTAVHAPAKAQEIVTGTLPTVGTNGLVFLESTHEGGRYGWNYELLKGAMSLQGQELNRIDFDFCFYPWYKHPDYIIPNGIPRLTTALREYFESLEQQHGIIISQKHQAWYCAMSATIPLGLMKQEFPSTPDEAFDTSIKGAIYADNLLVAETEGRMYQSLTRDAITPLYVSVDLGMSDDFTMWLIQPRDDGHYYVLDYFSCNGQTLNFYTNKVKEWEREHAQLVECCFLPHDANKRGLNSGLTTAQEWGKLGLPYKVLPRIGDLWQGIRWTRRFIDKCVFSNNISSEMQAANGDARPSGLNCLRNYRRDSKDGSDEESSSPVHDASSHGADSFRYFAEALERGLVSNHRKKRTLAKTIPNYYKN